MIATDPTAFDKRPTDRTRSLLQLATLPPVISYLLASIVISMVLPRNHPSAAYPFPSDLESACVCVIMLHLAPSGISTNCNHSCCRLLVAAFKTSILRMLSIVRCDRGRLYLCLLLTSPRIHRRLLLPAADVCFNKYN